MPAVLATFLKMVVSKIRTVGRPSCDLELKRGTSTRTGVCVRPVHPALGAILVLLVCGLAHGQAASTDPQRQSLGSLNSVGEVFVNESPAPSELTIFPNDTVRTGETGTAILTTSGNTSFQTSPLSRVVFTGDPRYFVELSSGTISVKSAAGASGAVVRAGNFVIVPTNRNERTIATINRKADGSAVIACLAGNVGVIPMQEAPGLFLEAGQSARISATGELAAVAASSPVPAPAPGKSHRTLIYLGLAGGGVAAGTTAALIFRGNHQPVSPMSP